MGEPLPAEVEVTELSDGVRYRLPGRDLGVFRFVGLPLILFGLFFAVLGCRLITSNIVFALPSIPSFLGGLAMVGLGLFILAGHSEIELRPGRVRAIERCGPIFWSWKRPTAGLRRVVVGSEDLTTNAGTTVDVPFADLASIRLEWDQRNRWPMLLALGYPRCVLIPLARELARRCEVAGEPTVGVAKATDPVQVVEEIPTDPSHFQEVHTRPAQCIIQLTETANGVQLLVPRLGVWRTLALRWMFLFGLLWFGVTFATVIPAVQGKVKVGKGPNATAATPLQLLLVLPIFGSMGLGIMTLAVYLGRREQLLAVDSATLIYLRTSPFGSKQRQWQRAQLADVRLGYRVVTDRGHLPDQSQRIPQEVRSWELEILPHLGEGTPLLVLGGYELDELRWVATVLRRALRLPPRPEGSAAPFRERLQQPADSDVVVEPGATGVTLRLPPMGFRRAGRGSFLALVLVFGFLIVLDGLLLAAGALDNPGGIMMLVFTLIFWMAGIAGLVNGFHMARRQTVLAVVGDQLLILLTGPLRSQRYEWPRSDIADIRVDEGDRFVFGGRRLMELQVVPKRGKPVGLLAGRADTELQWLATVLRHALGVPQRERH